MEFQTLQAFTGIDMNTSNLYMKGLPDSIDEPTLYEIFSRFGDVHHCGVQPSSQAEATTSAFVNLSTASQARDAVNALNGLQPDRSLLEVTPCPPERRQQTPCDNVYVRNLPSNWSEQELRDLFGAFGAVQECRILHRGDDFRGAGALVRMNNIEAASHAIATLNGHTPRGVSGESLTSMPLVVRYADTPEEKARKQARKEQLATRLHRSLDIPALSQEDSLAASVRHSSLPAGFQAFGPSGLVELGANLPSSAGLFGDSLQAETALDAMLSGMGPGTPHHSSETLSLPSSSLGALGYSPSKGLIQPPPPPPPPGGCASLYVKNLPPETDKLWLYERFAPHGAILSVKVLQEEHANRCRGVGFVNYTDPQGALNAIQNVNGMKVADKHLHVSLQTNRGRA